MNEIKYLIKDEFVKSKEDMEWMRDNEGVFVISTHYNKFKYVYKDGYFIRDVYAKNDKGWYLLPYKYVPRSEFEESVRGCVDDIVRHESDSWSKQWCPVQ